MRECNDAGDDIARNLPPRRFGQAWDEGDDEESQHNLEGCLHLLCQQACFNGQINTRRDPGRARSEVCKISTRQRRGELTDWEPPGHGRWLEE